MSTEVSEDIKCRTGMSDEELELVLKGNLEDLEMYTQIDRAN